MNDAIEMSRIDHIGIAVHDLDTAIKTYGALLACEVAPPEVLDARGIAVAFVDVGQPRIELLAPVRDDSELASFLAKRGEGMHHLCVRVDDLDEAVQQMQARGARLTPGGIKPGAGGSRVAFVHPKDAHGVLLELLEAPRQAVRADPGAGAVSIE